jgi:hypothetical protein
VPTKKVTLELEMDSDFESSIYGALGTLLAEVEDGEFRIKNVKVEDAHVLKFDQITPKLPVTTLRNIKNRSGRYLDDYDGQ